MYALENTRFNTVYLADMFSQVYYSFIIIFTVDVSFCIYILPVITFFSVSKIDV